MPDSDSVPTSVITRLLQLLRNQPILLYGLGSVLTLSVLVTTIGAAADQAPLVVGGAVVLLLAALGAGTYMLVRGPHGTGGGDTPSRGIKVTGRDVKARKGSTIVHTSESDVASSSLRVKARRDVSAEDGSSIVNVGPKPKKPC